jgi:hypothetical protein
MQKISNVWSEPPPDDHLHVYVTVPSLSQSFRQITCEYYPYPYSLHSHWHQRTHLCEAIRSQYYTKSLRNTTLFWYCYGVEYSQHFLIPCRFAAPPRVARRHLLNYLRSISVNKNQRSMSFQSMGGLLGRLTGKPIYLNMVGDKTRKLFSSLMKHSCRLKISSFGANFSKSYIISTHHLPSHLRAMAVQLLVLPYRNDTL